MSDGIKAKMINGLGWTSVNVFGMQAVQLVIGVFLARNINVSDFGKIGILFFFVGLSNVLIDGGFGQALLRKKEVSAADYSTFFYLNLATSVVLYLVLYSVAPFIALYYNQPDLTIFARVVFIAIIFYSFYFVQHVSLLKKLAYKSIAIINIVAVVLSGIIALLLAYFGCGIWVLIIQQLAFHFVKLILYPFFHKWRPVKAFSFMLIKQSWRFSIGIFLQTALNTIFANIYTLLIAQKSIQDTGYYTQAQKYNETVNTVSNSILTAGTYPVFAQIQDERERLLRIYRTLTKTVTLLIFPLVLFLIVAAKPLFITIITYKWINSVVFFQLLLFAHLFQSVYNINVNILNARGQSGDTLKLELGKKSFQLLSIFVCYKIGIVAMILGLLAANFVSFAFSMRLIKNTLGHFYRHQVLDIGLSLIFSCVIAVIVYPINYLHLKPIILLLFQSLSFGVLYFIGVYFFFPTKWIEVTRYLKSKLTPLRLPMR